MDLRLQTVVDFAAFYGLKIVIALLIFLIGIKVAKWLANLINKALSKSSMDVTLIKFIKEIIYFILMAIVVMAALSQAGVNVTSLVAVLGAVGIAIGLALQGSVANIGAAVLLMVFRPFKVGDFVDAGGKSGVVDSISLFSTTLTTTDNKVVILPNSTIISKDITNFSARDTRRVDFVFGVSYGDDIKKVKETLEEIVASEPRALKEPAHLVVVSELADSSVNFTVRIWVNTPDYWGVYFDTLERVKLAFDEKGITIPFPQREVWQRKEQ